MLMTEFNVINSQQTRITHTSPPSTSTVTAIFLVTTGQLVPLSPCPPRVQQQRESLGINGTGTDVSMS